MILTRQRDDEMMDDPGPYHIYARKWFAIACLRAVLRMVYLRRVVLSSAFLDVDLFSLVYVLDR